MKYFLYVYSPDCIEDEMNSSQELDLTNTSLEWETDKGWANQEVLLTHSSLNYIQYVTWCVDATLILSQSASNT